jgi:hypothetical protein
VPPCPEHRYSPLRRAAPRRLAAGPAVRRWQALPRLVKAHRTKDVRSYSLGDIALGNVGNLLYTVYVLDLPAGPIWTLHLFHTASTALMLFWYLRYVLVPAVRSHPAPWVPGGETSVVRDAQSVR